MIFLTVLIVFVAVQWWGSGAPFHKDQWFSDWHHRMTGIEFLNRHEGLVFAATVLGPALLLLIVIGVVGEIANWLLIVVYVPVFLYSLGRGEFTEPANDYLFAWNENDWEKALECFHLMNQETSSPDLEFDHGDWSSLNQAMLKSMSYKGFERLFAVSFWFVLLGPVGALVYRLVALFVNSIDETDEHVQARRWLWLLEWPAVRFLGLTFSLTGSFVGCIHAWKEKLLCAQSSTPEVLEHYIHGSLDIDETKPIDETITQREFKEIVSLYSRTLIFWVSILAVLTVLF